MPAPHCDWDEPAFHFKGFELDHTIERVVPTSHVFLIFELDGHTRHTFENDTLKAVADDEKAWVSGPSSKLNDVLANYDGSQKHLIELFFAGPRRLIFFYQLPRRFG